MTEAEPLRALPFLWPDRSRVKDFACFLHETLNQREDVLEFKGYDLSTSL